MYSTQSTIENVWIRCKNHLHDNTCTTYWNGLSVELFPQVPLLLVYLHSRKFICSMDGAKSGVLVRATRPNLLLYIIGRSSSKTESRSDMNLIRMNCIVISQSNTFQTPFNLLYIEIKICCEFMFKKWSSSILSNFSN